VGGREGWVGAVVRGEGGEEEGEEEGEGGEGEVHCMGWFWVLVVDGVERM